MKYLLIILISSALVSCKTEIKEDPALKTENIESVEQTKNVEVLFDQKNFSDPKMSALLRELNICNESQKDLKNASDPACDPSFFHMQPFIENEPIENAFLLLIKAGVHDWPLRRVLVYQREQGKLVLVNTFFANLIGTQKSSSKHDDLTLRFQDEYQNMFNCVYKWKENRYQFNSVAAINDSKIKASLQDSMNVEILKVISDSKLSS